MNDKQERDARRQFYADYKKIVSLLLISKKITARQEKVFDFYYKEKWTIEKIAKHFSISNGVVHKELRRVRGKIAAWAVKSTDESESGQLNLI